MKTVGERLNYWLAVRTLGRRLSTINYLGEIAGIVRKNWRDLNQPADSVTFEDVAMFAQKVMHYSPSRWNEIVSAIRGITQEGHKLKRRPMRFRDFTPPSKEEIQRLLVCADSMKRSNAGLVIRLLLLTGMRIGEARQLKWSHVFDDRIEIVASTAKNGHKRSIPLLNGAKAVLDELRIAVAHNPHKRADERAHLRKEYVLPEPSCRSALRKACKLAGIPHLSYHCLRHVFATRLIQSGVDTPTARFLGHRDGGALLARMYYHLLPEHAKAMAAKVAIF